jgi:hypothetical protein
VLRVVAISLDAIEFDDPPLGIILTQCGEVGDGSRGGGAQQGLELGEGHFDGTKVGTVRRQESRARACGLDGLSDAVHHSRSPVAPGLGIAAVSCVISTSALIDVGR